MATKIEIYFCRTSPSPIFFVGGTGCEGVERRSTGLLSGREDLRRELGFPALGKLCFEMDEILVRKAWVANKSENKKKPLRSSQGVGLLAGAFVLRGARESFSACAERDYPLFLRAGFNLFPRSRSYGSAVALLGSLLSAGLLPLPAGLFPPPAGLLPLPAGLPPPVWPGSVVGSVEDWPGLWVWWR